MRGCEGDIRSNLVRSKLCSPLFIILPHQLRSRQVKLARPQEPQEGLVVEPVVAEFGRLGLASGVICRAQGGSDEVGAELLEGGLLRGVSDVLACGLGGSVGKYGVERVMGLTAPVRLIPIQSTAPEGGHNGQRGMEGQDEGEGLTSGPGGPRGGLWQ